MQNQLLKSELENIKKNHKEKELNDYNINYLDACWICVKPNTDWRTAKKMGCKKDSYYGWIFYSTSTNSNGTELFEKIKTACNPFNMRVIMYEL